MDLSLLVELLHDQFKRRITNVLPAQPLNFTAQYYPESLFQGKGPTSAIIPEFGKLSEIQKLTNNGSKISKSMEIMSENKVTSSNSSSEFTYKNIDIVNAPQYSKISKVWVESSKMSDGASTTTAAAVTPNDEMTISTSGNTNDQPSMSSSTSTTTGNIPTATNSTATTNSNYNILRSMLTDTDRDEEQVDDSNSSDQSSTLLDFHKSMRFRSLKYVIQTYYSAYGPLSDECIELKKILDFLSFLFCQEPKTNSDDTNDKCVPYNSYGHGVIRVTHDCDDAWHLRDQLYQLNDCICTEHIHNFQHKMAYKLFYNKLFYESSFVMDLPTYRIGTELACEDRFMKQHSWILPAYIWSLILNAPFERLKRISLYGIRTLYSIAPTVWDNSIAKASWAYRIFKILKRVNPTIFTDSSTDSFCKCLVTAALFIDLGVGPFNFDFIFVYQHLNAISYKISANLARSILMKRADYSNIEIDTICDLILGNSKKLPNPIYQAINCLLHPPHYNDAVKVSANYVIDLRFFDLIYRYIYMKFERSADLLKILSYMNGIFTIETISLDVKKKKLNLNVPNPVILEKFKMLYFEDFANSEHVEYVRKYQSAFLKKTSNCLELNRIPLKTVLTYMTKNPVDIFCCIAQRNVYKDIVNVSQDNSILWKHYSLYKEFIRLTDVSVKEHIYGLYSLNETINLDVSF